MRLIFIFFFFPDEIFPETFSADHEWSKQSAEIKEILVFHEFVRFEMELICYV